MRSPARRRVTLATVRRLALALPDATEGTSYGTPSFHVKGKLFCRLKEDGETLALYVAAAEKAYLLQAFAAELFETDHYRGYPMVLLRLGASTQAFVKERVEEAWRVRAPRKSLDALNAGTTAKRSQTT